MLPFLPALCALALSPPALAGGLPDIDAPLKTGAASAADTAVVVGIEDYAFAPDVPFARRDASAFYDLLVYTRGVPASRVRMLTNGASKEQILAAVTEAGKTVGAGGTVWVYFAGHGAAHSSTGERMLLGDDVRADPVAFDARGVTVTELKALAGAGGGSVNLVVDACYSGLGRGGDELLAGKRFLVPQYAKETSPTVLEWSAASGDQLSGPLDAAQHGAFTYFAVGALRGWADGHIDGKPDGAVTAEEAQLYVRDALKTVQITDQTPELVVSRSSERVLMKGSGLEAAPGIDARAAASGGGGGLTVKVGPTGPVAAGDRAVTEAVVTDIVGRCVEKHAAGDATLRRWQVAFKVVPGKGVKGFLATPPADSGYSPSSTGTAAWACIRDDVKAREWTADKTTKERTFVTLAPGPSAPAATAPTPVAAPATAETTTVAAGVAGLGVSMTVTESGTVAAPVAAAPGKVSVVFRSRDGEWFDVQVDGQTVAELRNEDEVRVPVSPGVHTVELVKFMADEPFATGRLDTAGAAEIIFGVRTDGGVEVYNHDGWERR